MQVIFYIVDKKSPPVELVVHRLGSIFEVLNGTSDENDESLLKQLGAEIGEKFCAMFIRDVLQNSVPITAEEKTLFVQNVSQNISDMEQYLKSTGKTPNYNTLNFANEFFQGFLRPDQSSITDYVQNIDLHFVNKSCQRYLQLAREIICKDLHNILEITVEVYKYQIFSKHKTNFAFSGGQQFS